MVNQLLKGLDRLHVLLPLLAQGMNVQAILFTFPRDFHYQRGHFIDLGLKRLGVCLRDQVLALVRRPALLNFEVSSHHWRRNLFKSHGLKCSLCVGAMLSIPDLFQYLPQ